MGWVSRGRGRGWRVSDGSEPLCLRSVSIQRSTHDAGARRRRSLYGLRYAHLGSPYAFADSPYALPMLSYAPLCPLPCPLGLSLCSPYCRPMLSLCPRRLSHALPTLCLWFYYGLPMAFLCYSPPSLGLPLLSAGMRISMRNRPFFSALLPFLFSRSPLSPLPPLPSLPPLPPLPPPLSAASFRRVLPLLSSPRAAPHRS